MPITLSHQRLRSIVDSQQVSQKELVERTGISRAQLSRILKRKDPSVREDTLLRLAKGLGVPPTSITVDGPLAKLQELVVEETAYVDFRGMGFPKIEAQKIEDVFVDLETENDLSKDECQESQFVDLASGQAERPVLGLDRLASNDRAVLIGNPGSGKTTVLRFFAHKNCSGSGPPTFYVRLPEFCKARDANNGLTPIQFIAGREGTKEIPGVAKALDECLRDDKTQCVFLFDGLDEIGGDQRQSQLTRDLHSFFREYPFNRFFVTSRVVGFDKTPWVENGFGVFKVRDYSSKQQGEFTKKWSSIIAKMDRKNQNEIRENISSEVFSHARVRALASSPLISTILVLLHHARGGMLPTRRVDLYAKVVDVFLETWEGSKVDHDAIGSAYNINLDGRELRWLLSDLSLALQRAEQTVAARWWLMDQIVEFLQEKLGFEPIEGKESCDRILRYLCERTGLISEVGPDTFAFSHRTLQEYFASLGVVDEADSQSSRDVTECLREYLFHPQWSEVVRLVAAQSTPPTAESLLATLVDDPDPVGRFLHRGTFAALRCLGDGATVANRKFVASLFESLVGLGRSKWLGLTFEAIDTLEMFEGSRMEQLASRTVNQILDNARSAEHSGDLTSDECESVEDRIHIEEIWHKMDEVISHEDAPNSMTAVQEEAIEQEGQTHKLFFVNHALLAKNQNQWYESCCLILKSDDASPEIKRLVVRELGKRVATVRRARIRLRKILRSDADEELRGTSASYLSVFATHRREQALLLNHMRCDLSRNVRGECAAALEIAAMSNEKIAKELSSLVQSNEPVPVRAGAARGLDSLARTDSSVRAMLLKEMANDSCPEKLRSACLWSLSDGVGDHSEVLQEFRTLLESSNQIRLQRCSAQVLASAMANESIAWDHHDIERIEHILMNLKNPCPHAFWSLEELATTRALRAGLRLDAILRDTLRPYRDKIDLAFVFGSTARKRQNLESDVDLFIIGTVTLKEISVDLSKAERILGRQINPVINSAETIAAKWKSRDPFMLEVFKGPKIPILKSRETSEEGDLDDELKAMATVGLDSNP